MKQSMWRTTTAWGARVLVLAAVALALMLVAGGNGHPIAAQGAVDTSVEAEGASGQVTAEVHGPVSGHLIQPQILSQPPAVPPERVRAREAQMMKSNRAGPEGGDVATVPNTPPVGPADAAPSGKNLPATSGYLALYRDSTIPGYNPSGPQPQFSYTMEPSLGNNGGNVFQTGNWYTSFSKDNGSTWSFLDPYSFGTYFNFCCDQVAIYDPGRDLQFWLMQGDHLRLAVSKGTDLANWCYFDFDSTSFGQPASTEIDYNDMNISEGNLFIASNLFPATSNYGGAGVLRIPLDDLTTCETIHYGSLAWVPGGSNGWSFTWKLISGAGQTMY